MPKKTLAGIKASVNDYVVKVKANQRRLLGAMEEIHRLGKPKDRSFTKERNRGRLERRTIKTYPVNAWIRSKWPGARTIIHVLRERRIKGKKVSSQGYYLSSRVGRAAGFAKGIRHHWGIENRLHYVKDVTLKEDESRIRCGNAPVIFSLMRNLVINIVRMSGENRIKKFIRQCAGNIKRIAWMLE